MRLACKAGVLIAALIVCSSFSSFGYAAVYYVDRNNSLASDNNPGTSALPFKTITKGAKVAVAGDQVIVKAGTYNELVSMPRSGQPGLPIRFTARKGVIVQPPSRSYWHGAIDIVGKSDIIVEGFRVQNAFFGLNIDKDFRGVTSARIVLRGNYTYVTESSGIHVAAASDVVIDSNVVEKSVWGGVQESIVVTATSKFTVNNNEVFNGSWTMNGVAVEGREGIDILGGSISGAVTNNRVHDLVRLGIYIDGSKSGVSDVDVSGNVVYRCRYGVAIASESGGLVKNITVRNNLTHHNSMFGIAVAKWVNDGPRQNIRIDNNTVSANVLGGIVLGTTNVSGLYLHNNISAHNVGQQIIATSLAVITESKGNIIYGPKLGNMNIGVTYGDPRFVDATVADYRLGVGSAAANAGVVVTGLTKDIIGAARPKSLIYDVGAYEQY